MLKKDGEERRTITSIKVVVLEDVMKPPFPPPPPPRGSRVHGSFFAGPGGFSEPIIAYYFFVNYRLHLCPLSGKTGMEWEPYVKN